MSCADLCHLYPPAPSDATDGRFRSGRRTDGDGATTIGDRVEAGIEELRRAVARSLDAELIHPVAKCVWMKVQHPRRALWTINHSS